jgi:dihydrofolate reductase
VKLTLLAAVCENRLGDSQGIPWRCPGEQAIFKGRTIGHTLIVGARTALTLPPLDGRALVVWGRDSDPQTIVETLREAGQDQVYLIGGGATYRAFMPWVDSAFVSYIDRQWLTRPWAEGVVEMPQMPTTFNLMRQNLYSNWTEGVYVKQHSAR